MKIALSHKLESANTLLVSVVITGVIGFLLAAYLGLVKSQNVATMRTQSWNATVPIIEAGLEDALTHINNRGTNDLSSDGWQKQGSLYVTKRWIGPNYYTVVISNWVVGRHTNSPVIESRGYVSAPAAVASIQGPVFAAATANPNRPFVARGVRVTAKCPSLFTKSMVAKGSIDMAGNNIYVDSFDSTDTNKSTNGKWDINKRQDNGWVATNSSLTNSLNVGSAEIYGRVSTGPKGKVAIGSGAVGDKSWVDGGNTGIKPGYHTDDMNMEFPDVVVPFSGGQIPSAGSVNGVAYDLVLTSGDYISSSEVKNKKIAIVGHVRWHVPAGIKQTGGSVITVMSNASVNMYAGTSADLGGNGVINNTGNAANFFLWGKTNLTDIKFHGNGTFYGVIYAPNAHMQLNGGGSGNEDVSGATITKSVDFNGHFKFHYDENLARLPLGKGYVVTSWNEMTPAQVAAGPSL